MEPKKILVIEDDDIVIRTIERCLRGGDFKVTLANSGVEGLQTGRRIHESNRFLVSCGVWISGDIRNFQR